MCAEQTTAVEFDPFSSTYFDDPYETYRRLREEAPVYYNPTYDFYALSRFDDVCAASKDWATFTSTHGVDLSMLSAVLDGPLDSLIMMDPPRHDRLRALVSRVFTPRAVKQLEPLVREVISEQLATLEGRSPSTRSPTSPGRSRSRSSRACSGSPPASARRSATGSTSPCTARRAR